MPDPQSLPLTVGVRGAYEWLASEHRLDDLLRLCPQIVLGKYIAVTSVDSGSFFPTAEELAKGWERRNGIAYIPKVEKVEILPREGWDEWYAFEDRVDLGGMAAPDSNPFEAPLGPGAVYAFVNYNSLAPDLPKLQGIAPYFWKQFDWVALELMLPRAAIIWLLSAAIRSFLESPAKLSQVWSDPMTIHRTLMAANRDARTTPQLFAPDRSPATVTLKPTYCQLPHRRPPISDVRNCRPRAP
jgi:hypothetical protein